MQPQNFPDVALALFNAEIWTPLTSSQTKCDLKIINMQQALQMAIFAIALSCNSILTAKMEGRNPDHKELLSRNLLFWWDLANQVRDAEETKSLGKTLGTAKAQPQTTMANDKVLGERN